MAFLAIKMLYGQITMTMIATVMMYLTGTENYESVTYSTTRNYDCATTATVEHCSPTTSLRPAGTSLLLHSGYSNVVDSSTSFRELQKVDTILYYTLRNIY